MLELIIALLFVIIILQIIIFFNLKKSKSYDDSELKEKISKAETTLTAKLDAQPELTSAKLAETMHSNFTKLRESVDLSGRELIEKFGEFKNDLTLMVSNSDKQSAENFNEFRNKLMKNQNSDFEELRENLTSKFNIISESIQDKNQKLSEKFTKIQNEIGLSLEKHQKLLADNFKGLETGLSKSLREDFDRQIETVEKKLSEINTKVSENLKEGFNKTNETFQNVIQRLAKIDEAQKKIENLSTNVVSLQDILTDKKSRGTFGEVQLNQVLHSAFGEKNDKIFQTQYRLKNGTSCDAILFMPEPIGAVAIDSKFPLENYRRMIDKSLNQQEKSLAEKAFDTDVRKHINDISEKYIIPGETADQAILFLPAEAIFAEIYAHFDSLVEYSRKKHVWITSPTTFMAVLSTIQVVIRNLEQRKFANIIQQEISKLSEEFTRYQDRWDKLSKHIGTVSKDVDNIHITNKKISVGFERISRVQLDDERESKMLNK